MPSLFLLAIASTAVTTFAAAQDTTANSGIEAARRGGVTMVCRHGITDPADENETTLRYDDPSTQRRLSARGERQSQALGAAFRALQLPIGDVIASPMQRAARTAELAFGRVERDSAWHTRGEDFSGWKMERRLKTLGAPPPRGTRVVVSHIGTIYSVLPSIRGQLEEGDCAIVRPRTRDTFDVVGVVPWSAWLRAANLKDSIP